VDRGCGTKASVHAGRAAVWLDFMAEGKIIRMPIASGATSAYRRWQLCWGATPAEVAGTLPGDDMCPSPRVSFTRAITVSARPDEIWPWLVQVGFGPDGRYAYDVSDGPPADPTRHHRLGTDTADESAAAAAEPGSVPASTSGRESGRPVLLHVSSFHRPDWLLWETAWGSWVWVLRPLDERSTRLITRGRQRQHIDPRLPRGVLPTEDADFRLVRKMLTGIKRRSEAWAAELAGQRPGTG